MQKMRLAGKRIKMAMLSLLVFTSMMLLPINVQAATGKTTIAVSSGEVTVGEELSVTIKAKTEGGNTAKAKLKLTYNEEVLEFTSCSETYDGGAGGSVTATASSMTVKFKAIAEGRSSLAVEASNGVVSSSGSSLSEMEGCSTNIDVKAAPESAPAATEQTTETEEVPTGPTELETAPTEIVEDTTREELEQVLEQNEYLSNSYNKLEEKYQREKDFSRSVIYVLIFVIAILIVVIINIIVFYRKQADAEFDDSFETKKPVAKKEIEKSIEKPIVKPIEKPVEIKKEEVKREEVKKASAPKMEQAISKAEKATSKTEKIASKVEKAAPKVEVRNNLEVFDFNDED